jgi:hypothetical protein
MDHEYHQRKERQSHEPQSQEAHLANGSIPPNDKGCNSYDLADKYPILELEPFAKLAQWVVFRMPDKAPLVATHPKRMASTNRPSTWRTYAEARAATLKNGADYGVGFVLTDTRVGGIDLDGCRNAETGELEAWASEIVEKAKASKCYVEVSPSRTGVHILGLCPQNVKVLPGTVIKRRDKNDQLKKCGEVYRACKCERENGRYLTITGWRLSKPSETVGDITALQDEVWEQYGGKEKAKPTEGGFGPMPTGNRSAEWQPEEGLETLDLAPYSREMQGQIRETILNGDYEGHEEPFPSKSEAVYFVTCRLAAIGKDDDTIVAILLNPLWAISEHVRKQKKSQKYAEKQVADADKDPNTVPIIADRIGVGALAASVALTHKALLRSGQAIMERGWMLTRPLSKPARALGGGQTTVTVLEPFEFHSLNLLVSKAAEYRRWDGRVNKRQGDWSMVDPRELIVKTVLHDKDGWPYPACVGLAQVPVMTADGQLNASSGYDPASQLYLALDPNLSLPPVPAEPSQDECLEQIEGLAGLLEGFPFVDEKLDSSVALAALLTGVYRPSCDVAPGFIFRAPIHSAGKSFLAHIVSSVATGQRVALIDLGRGKAEDTKRLDSGLLSARPIILLDNYEGVLGGSTLAQALSETRVAIRTFGLLKEQEIECRAMIIATGINVKPTDHLVRRVLSVDLDPKLERPELRRFAHDPLVDAVRERGRWLAAAFTMYRGWLKAGKPEPNGYQPLSGYGQWCEFVRKPLLWLGYQDPIECIDKNRAEDPELSDIAEFLEGIMKTMGRETFTLAKLIEQADLRNQELLTFLRSRFPGSDEDTRGIDVRKLGTWVSEKVKGRPLGGTVLYGEKKQGHPTRYTAAKAAVTDAAQGGMGV